MLSKYTLHTGEYLRMVKVGHWEYVERLTGKDVVYIIPVYTNEYKGKELVFIKEFRVPVQDYVIGFPAGLVGDINKEETIKEAVHKELIEETGYATGSIVHLFSGPSSAGLSDEMIHFYMAEQLEKVGEGGGDDTESIEVIKVRDYEALSWLDDMSKVCMIGPKVYAGLFFYLKDYFNGKE